MRGGIRVLAALLILAIAWFGTLDYRKLVKPDEGRYAEIPREMVVSGDWLTPRLNSIKYFEKPPLQYWTTAAAYELFGQSEWTSRLWTALTGFLGVVLIWLTGRRLFGPQAGNLAATTLASMFLYTVMSHVNTLDMGLTFFLELALCAFMLAQERRAHWMLLAWAALGLAVLSKGPVALVLTGGTIVLYSLLSRDWSPWRNFNFRLGIPLFLVVVVPWFLLVSLANPEFPNFFFIHEHVDRFLTKVHRRYEPAWFFIPVLLLGLLPWTTFSVPALVQAWRRRTPAAFEARRFLLLWCAVVFGFFSISDSKLPSYILPMFPAIALLLGDALTRTAPRTITAHAVFIALLAVTGLAFAPRLLDRVDDVTPMYMMGPYLQWINASAALWLAGALAAAGLAWRGRKQLAIAALAVSSFVATNGVLLGHDFLNRSSSAAYIASQIKPLLPADVPLYSVRMYDQTLPFYLQRTVTLVSIRDEMAFGIAQEPERWIPTIDDFAERWAADRDAFAIMEIGEYDTLLGKGFAMNEVARDTRRIIVRKPQP